MKQLRFMRPRESDSLRSLLNCFHKRYFVLSGLAGILLTTGSVLLLSGLGLGVSWLSIGILGGSCGFLLSAGLSSVISLYQKRVSRLLTRYADAFCQVDPTLSITGEQLAKAVTTKPQKTMFGYVNYAYFLDQKQQIRVIRETTSNRIRSTGMAVLPKETSQPYLSVVEKKETKKGPQLVLKRN